MNENVFIIIVILFCFFAWVVGEAPTKLANSNNIRAEKVTPQKATTYYQTIILR